MPGSPPSAGNNPAPPSPDADRERLCRRCGLCCHEKIRVDGRVVITDVPCPFLDAASRTCTVYAERFTRQPHCATADRSAAAGGMPGDCPYVRDLPDYDAPWLLRDHPEYAPLVAEYFPGRSPIGMLWERLHGLTSPTVAAPPSRELAAERAKRPPSRRGRPSRRLR